MTRFHKFLPVRNDISTHTLTLSVTATILHYMENHIFQLTRSRGAWHFASGLTNEQLNFNSHAHVERDYTTGAGTAIVFNFNSHAHVERDCKNHAHQTYLQNISTHTLTWSVTCMVCNANPRVHFNSHAHVERDACRFSEISWMDYFNSHAHVERDLKRPLFTTAKTNFNSHAHVERDWGKMWTNC